MVQTEARGRDARARRSHDHRGVHQWKPQEWGECTGHCNYGNISVDLFERSPWIRLSDMVLR